MKKVPASHVFDDIFDIYAGSSPGDWERVGSSTSLETARNQSMGWGRKGFYSIITRTSRKVVVQIDPQAIPTRPKTLTRKIGKRTM